MRVKVCGTTTVEGARVAIEAGADMLGFIMSPGSPRTLTVEAAAAIIAQLPRDIEMVGVFVNSAPGEVLAAANAAGFTAVQLHGDERWEDWADSDMPVIKTVRAGAGPPATDWPPGSLVLADTSHPRLRGGTGIPFDWDLAQDICARHRLIVSGGLDATNVAEAVGRLEPWGVDASSRLEVSPGVKDAGLVRAFVAAAREAEAGLVRVG